jgi:hypothetical protein
MEIVRNYLNKFVAYLRTNSKDILILLSLSLTVWLTAFRYVHDVERLYYRLLRTDDLYPPYNYRVLPILLETGASMITGLSLETVSVTLCVLFMLGASLILRTKEELIWSALPLAWLALIGWRSVLLQDCLAFFLLTICIVYHKKWIALIISPLLGLTREIAVGFLFFIETYRKRYDVAIISAIIGGAVAIIVRLVIPGDMGFTPLIILAPENLNPDTFIKIICDLSFVLIIWFAFGRKDTWWIVAIWSIVIFVMAVPSEVRLWLPIFLLLAKNSITLPKDIEQETVSEVISPD